MDINRYICRAALKLQEIINLLSNILVSLTELNCELNQTLLLHRFIYKRDNINVCFITL